MKPHQFFTAQVIETYLVGFNASGNSSSISRAEAVRQGALSRVTVRGPVRVLFHGASVLIRLILTVRLVITEETLLKTLAISTGQFTFGADWLVRFENG